jgi:hypothetical protein
MKARVLPTISKSSICVSDMEDKIGKIINVKCVKNNWIGRAYLWCDEEDYWYKSESLDFNYKKKKIIKKVPKYYFFSLNKGKTEE